MIDNAGPRLDGPSLKSARSFGLDHSKMRPGMALVVVLIILILCTCVQVSGQGQTVILERGHRGIVPCPPIQINQFRQDEITGVYWYFGQEVAGSLLISYFRGTAELQNGIPEGVFDIDRNFSLVIENVTDSYEGSFFCTIKPKGKARQTGSVTVAIRVSPTEPFPSILGCDPITSQPSECSALISYDTVSPNLTCVVRYVKPAVAIRWLRVFGGGDVQLVNATQMVENVVLPEHTVERGSFLINNTYMTSSAIQLSASDDNTSYRCEAYGTALGDKNGSHLTATIIVEVSPREPFPSILGCDSISSKPSECRAEISYDTVPPNLTCVVRHVKPAVVIGWLRVSEEGGVKHVSATQAVENVVLPEHALKTGWFVVNSTYTTSSSIQLSANDDNTRYRCEAYGTALGDHNGSYVTATIILEVPSPVMTGIPAIGTSTSFDTDTTTPATKVPYLPPVTPDEVVLGASLSVVLVLVLIITGILLLFVKHRRKHTRGNRGRNTSPRDLENLSLLDMGLSNYQQILKSFFLAKMQYISTGLFDETDEDSMHTDDIFVDLELHEKGKSIIIESREQLIQLLGGKKQRRHFVVKGEAGCGKTTLVRQFGFDWANESEYIKHFSLVFVLKMKEMTDSPGLMDAILEQNFPKEQRVDKNRLRKVIDEVGDKVLIFLDGLDEISSTVLNRQAEAGDISVKDVLVADSMPQSYVIVTTRPHMMTKLRSYSQDIVYTEITTTGFTKKNRNEYIKRRFRENPNKAGELIQEIETAAFLEILATKPIMLKLLCYIRSRGEMVPERITQLYDRAMEALVAYMVKRRRLQVPESDRCEWKTKLQKELGKVAFEGLMDDGGERLVFRRDLFSEKTLNDAFELGLFSKDTSSELYVTMIHKTFQEYLAACYLSAQSQEFIKQRLLSKVNIDSIERMEYLLRFSCGMNLEVASVIFQHVRNIKDELISDRYLWVQHLTLMLYYEAQSDSLGAGVGSRLALKYKEEFAALQYYVENVASARQGSSNDLPPSAHLERLEVYLHVIKDQSKVTSILEHVDVDYLYFGLLLSDELEGEIQELIDDTVSKLPYRPARTIVCIDKKESEGTSGAVRANKNDGRSSIVDIHRRFCRWVRHVCRYGLHTEPVLAKSLEPFSRVSADLKTCKNSQVYICGFGLRVECDVIKSVDDFSNITACLVACQAVYFGVLNNNLNGYLSSLSTLIQSLQYLELYNCSL